MLPGSDLKILHDSTSEHVSMKTTLGRAASAASVASEDADRTLHDAPVSSYDDEILGSLFPLN